MCRIMYEYYQISITIIKCFKLISVSVITLNYCLRNVPRTFSKLFIINKSSLEEIAISDCFSFVSNGLKLYIFCAIKLLVK